VPVVSQHGELPLSLDVDHKKLGIEPKVLKPSHALTTRRSSRLVRQKFAEIRDRYNELRLIMAGGFAVSFSRYNEGADVPL